VTTRHKHLQDVNSLYGLPGINDTDIGKQLLIETIEEMGYAALSDDALAELAKKHREEDFRMCAKADAEYRRGQRRRTLRRLAARSERIRP
jgi:hypothetical protein